MVAVVVVQDFGAVVVVAVTVAGPLAFVLVVVAVADLRVLQPQQLLPWCLALLVVRHHQALG